MTQRPEIVNNIRTYSFENNYAFQIFIEIAPTLNTNSNKCCQSSLRNVKPLLMEAHKLLTDGSPSNSDPTHPASVLLEQNPMITNFTCSQGAELCEVAKDLQSYENNEE